MNRRNSVFLAGLVGMALVGLLAVVWRSVPAAGENDTFLPMVGDKLLPMVPETTVILTEESIQYLTSVSSDGSLYTFSQSTPELDRLDVGDVMVGDVSDAAPNGFLRRVTQIEASGDQLTVTTAPAALDEAIEQAQLHIRQPLVEADVDWVQYAEGASPAAPVSCFLRDIENLVLYDADGDPATTGDQVVADGNLELEMGFAFDMIIRDSEAEFIDFSVEATADTSLQVTSGTDAALNVQHTLSTCHFDPITIDIPLPPPRPPLPVVLLPTMDVVIGLDGSVHSELSVGYTANVALDAGAQYSDGEWRTLLGEFTPDMAPLQIEPYDEISAKVYAGPELQILFHGVPGPRADVRGFFELQVDPTASPWWQLYGGLEAPVAVETEILSHDIAGFGGMAIDWRELLAQSEGYTCTDSDGGPNYYFAGSTRSHARLLALVRDATLEKISAKATYSPNTSVTAPG